MSDQSPLRLTESGQSSSPSQSIESHNFKQQHNQERNDNYDHDRINHNHNNLINDNQRHRAQSESSSKSGHLRYGARNVIELFIPVSICMVIVVGTMKATDSYHYSSQSVIWYAQMMYTDQSVDTGTRVWQSFANALILLIFIAIMTTVLILLYKFKFYRTIHGWLILSSLLLLFMFALNYVAEILKVYNIPMDYITLCIFIWNFGVVGMFCIHWKGPLLLQQAYLITISALMALTLIRCLPDWTIWTVLAIVSVWDLIAVLCPRGPLRILVEIAQERNEQIFPALIYSSMMIWEIGSGVLSTTIVSSNLTTMMADDNNSSKEKSKSSKSSRNNDKLPRASTSSNNSKHRQLDSGETRRKRNQHPVEIHYEDGAQPPEVAFIQPNSLDRDQYRRSKAENNQTNRERRHRSRGSEDVERGRAAISDGDVGFDSNQPRVANQLVQVEDDEERGVKLGLGDFIFYSVLVGKASSYGDWTITLSCYVSILVGLCLTLSLLAVFRKALPALPISIAFGLSSFFLSYLFVVPFSEILATNQVFI